mmetsp:Transcript_63246/g.151117  ORF Transcript_63246/g.151117 Transcript_63246/m.151117 type:complete len:112 (+) Transcript_63246:1757-2092(+)
MRCLCLLYRVSHGLRRPCDTSQPVERATEIRLCSDRRGILAFLLIITMNLKDKITQVPSLFLVLEGYCLGLASCDVGNWTVSSTARSVQKAGGRCVRQSAVWLQPQIHTSL